MEKRFKVVHSETHERHNKHCGVFEYHDIEIIEDQVTGVRYLLSRYFFDGEVTQSITPLLGADGFPRTIRTDVVTELY